LWNSHTSGMQTMIAWHIQEETIALAVYVAVFVAHYKASKD
jgi:hypothetical protein